MTEPDRFDIAVRKAITDAAKNAGPAEARIAKALDLLVRNGGTSGGHHVAWVIDQVVRALTGCPDVEAEARDYRGHPYTYVRQSESEHYLRLVAAACDGEDGPETYEWDTGVAP